MLRLVLSNQKVIPSTTDKVLAPALITGYPGGLQLSWTTVGVISSDAQTDKPGERESSVEDK